MGYTHYWNSMEHLNTERFEILRRATVKAIELSGVDITLDDDEDAILFNGVGDDEHEDMALSPDGEFSCFCKTARKPYDVVVVACLYMAELLIPGFHWTSDGDPDELADGLELAEICSRTFGSNWDGAYFQWK